MKPFPTAIILNGEDVIREGNFAMSIKYSLKDLTLWKEVQNIG